MEYTTQMLASLQKDLQHYSEKELYAVKAALSKQGKKEPLQLVREELNRRLNQAA